MEILNVEYRLCDWYIYFGVMYVLETYSFWIWSPQDLDFRFNWQIYKIILCLYINELNRKVNWWQDKSDDAQEYYTDVFTWSRQLLEAIYLTWMFVWVRDKH